ncbi:hypothetical protein [Candidatus Rhabdochlamydia porcellionis]|jgi:hypothetical protein|uniref:K1 capsule-specific polysaccharide lyase C-terminal domain-containing protein n=1 Tax=Candidatus Rhabdochlamydia porcellionis TaxID=225148 RepID=A0ABX8Z1C4_9BACT|nr:hypothetical protein [Candidatus Rhabdochlamydia porcellionis]QZA59476.1 hypothetical protein RHAB15C_0001410 [Candidatus Rhabdochlamydia porcellionis]
MAKITNAINVPVSSSLTSLTLGNSSNFIGVNTLDCSGSAAFGTVAGTTAPANSLVTSPFLGIGAATQFLSGSTAEFVMPITSTECDLVQTSYVGSSATNASNLIHLTARGTALAPTANQSGDIIGEWGVRGYNGTSFSSSSMGYILMSANENWTTTANGTNISLQVTSNTTTTLKQVTSILNSSASISGVAIPDQGSGFLIKEGSNARMGVVTLSAGSATVLNSTVTANTRIFLTVNGQSSLNLLGFLRVTGRTPGVSFTISTGIALDFGSVVGWLLIEPI